MYTSLIKQEELNIVAKRVSEEQSSNHLKLILNEKTQALFVKAVEDKLFGMYNEDGVLTRFDFLVEAWKGYNETERLEALYFAMNEITPEEIEEIEPTDSVG